METIEREYQKMKMPAANEYDHYIDPDGVSSFKIQRTKQVIVGYEDERIKS